MPQATPPDSFAASSHYRIAAVSKLSGVAVPTIRMWERRYKLVSPARSAANGRLYSRADIDRLSLLKAAVDAGHAIGTIAALPDEQIRLRLRAAPGPTASPAQTECRVLVCGFALAEHLQQAWGDRTDIRVSGRLPGPVWGEGQAAVEPADAVIIESPTLQAACVRQTRQLRAQTGARVVIVVYGFGNRQTLARLDQEGVITLGSPAEPLQLARICHLALAIEPRADHGVDRRLLQPAAARRYGDAFLASVDRTSTAIHCECPHHLAHLLIKLNAFEDYSLECESAGVADAAIHALLHSAASHCRELLELALSKVLEHEGIDPSVEPTASKLGAGGNHRRSLG